MPFFNFFDILFPTSCLISTIYIFSFSWDFCYVQFIKFMLVFFLFILLIRTPHYIPFCLLNTVFHDCCSNSSFLFLSCHLHARLAICFKCPSVSIKKACNLSQAS